MELCVIKDQYEIGYPVGRYINEAIEFISRVTNKITSEELLPKRKEIILWCRGSSGSILAALLASKLVVLGFKVIIRHVKKPGEDSHTSNGWINDYNYFNIIIDDFVATGDTIVAISKEMAKSGIEEIDCIIVSASHIQSEIIKKNEIHSVSLVFPTPKLLLTGGHIPSIKLLKQLLVTNLPHLFNNDNNYNIFP